MSAAASTTTKPWRYDKLSRLQDGNDAFRNSEMYTTNTEEDHPELNKKQEFSEEVNNLVKPVERVKIDVRDKIQPNYNKFIQTTGIADTHTSDVSYNKANNEIPFNNNSYGRYNFYPIISPNWLVNRRQKLNVSSINRDHIKLLQDRTRYTLDLASTLLSNRRRYDVISPKQNDQAYNSRYHTANLTNRIVKVEKLRSSHASKSYNEHSTNFPRNLESDELNNFTKSKYLPGLQVTKNFNCK